MTHVKIAIKPARQGTLLQLVGIVFVLVGNYLPKSRQNYVMGIKLPWTLNDTENWNKTNRLAGYLYIIGGIGLGLSSWFMPFSGVAQVWVMVTVVVAVMAVPFIYSYILYKQKLQ